MKFFSYILISLFFLSFNLIGKNKEVRSLKNSINEKFQTKKADFLVKHLMNSIEKADQGKSKLNQTILDLEGMSSSKNRHLLNNLCSLPGTHYLEIGVWKGSTYISALYHNDKSIRSTIAIDNWSQFSGPYDVFMANLKSMIPNYKGKVISQDCFTVNKHKIFSHPINIYFFDGDHSFESQKLAFTYFNDILDDVFIALVDDYNYTEVQLGTKEAFKELNYKILYEQFLPARFNCDRENWWNGLYVAVIQK